MHIATKPQTDSVTTREGKTGCKVDYMRIEKENTFDLHKRVVNVDTHDGVALEGASPQLVRPI